MSSHKTIEQLPKSTARPRHKSISIPLIQRLTGPAAAKYGALPKIQLPGEDELQRSFNANALHALKNSGLYRRGSIPVTVFESSLTAMNPARFLSWATKYFIPYKLRTKRDGIPIQKIVDMTKSVAEYTLSSDDFIEGLDPIHRIYPSPVPLINENKTLILCTPGYDQSSGTYVHDGNLDPVLPDPSRPPLTHLVGSDNYFDDSLTLSEAFWYLYDLLCHFPFSDYAEPVTPPVGHPLHAYDPVSGDHRTYTLSRSLAVHVGAMLAIFAANCVPREAGRMAFAYSANEQRSGKTLLAAIAASPTHGRFKCQPWSEDEESLKKILDSEALAGSPYICFDNVRGLIQSQSLEAFITSSTWTGRHLGRSEMFTAENNSVILITGNNITLGTDIQHRTLWCDLYVEDADPQARVIDGPIIDDAWLANPVNRRAILSALWAIVRHWDNAGRPPATAKTRQGFDTWCKIIGGMVEFAGFGDMLASPKLQNAGDTEAEDVFALVKALHQQDAADFTFQQVIHTCWEEGLFLWTLNGREEPHPLREGWPASNTLRLDSKCCARMGILLSRHATKRGTVHTIPDPQTGRQIRVRFSHRGKGRHRLFFVTPHAPPPPNPPRYSSPPITPHPKQPTASHPIPHNPNHN